MEHMVCIGEVTNPCDILVGIRGAYKLSEDFVTP